MDWFSTALELGGVKVPDERVIDGMSLTSVLAGGPEFDR